jgi:hypothetical protein
VASEHLRDEKKAAFAVAPGGESAEFIQRHFRLGDLQVEEPGFEGNGPFKRGYRRQVGHVEKFGTNLFAS